MNWRNLFFKIGMHKINSQLKSMIAFDDLKPAQLKDICENKLRETILYAYEHVPFYKRCFIEAGLVNKGVVNMMNFSKVPLLTKEIIGRAGMDLYSDQHDKYGSFKNHTGGTTGIPIEFIQDQGYYECDVANMMYFKTFGGQIPGQKELRLWGSERDLLPNQRYDISIRNYFYNRIDLNAFMMDHDKMNKYILQINRFKPRWIEAYADSIYELSKFIEKNKIVVHSPAGIVTGAGTLFPEMHELISKVFRTKVYNRYGSRELGGVACSCAQQQGLHISEWRNKVEIIDENCQPLEAGKTGRIVVTTLTNYSMPLIRYEIGDYGSLTYEQCPCGRPTIMFKNVVGRYVESIKKRNGETISPLLFIHFIGVVFNTGGIKKFQVIQKSYDYILIKLVLGENINPEKIREKVELIVKKVMDDKCEVGIEVVNDILPNKNGKYLYVVSEI